MPGGDRTGPMGMGPMTGRAAGYCAGYADPVPGRGFGMGWGRSWRWPNWYYAAGLPARARFGYAPAWGYGPYAAPPTQEQLVQSLKTEAEWLKDQLDAVNQHIAELEKEK